MDAIVPILGTLKPGMLLADIHVHTTCSDGWWQPEQLAEAAVQRGLSALAVTDHDDCRAGFIMADYCARRSLPLTVYPGSEISAREGGHDVHVLGINVRTEVRPWQSVAQTVEEIFKQGAIAVLPHPRPDGFGWPAYSQILGLETPVGVEVYNSAVVDLQWAPRRGPRENWNERAVQFYREHASRLLGAVGGTDAHFRTVGRGLTAYEGDLLDAIRERRTVVAARQEREQLRPWDVVGYFTGLRRMDKRRAARWVVLD